jgi:hypothetical protein
MYLFGKTCLVLECAEWVGGSLMAGAVIERHESSQPDTTFEQLSF